jgi:hypothetical protein
MGACHVAGAGSVATSQSPGALADVDEVTFAIAGNPPSMFVPNAASGVVFSDGTPLTAEDIVQVGGVGEAVVRDVPAVRYAVRCNHSIH